MSAATSGRLVCAWFVRCTNDADGTLPHPILGDVPCCNRCASLVGEVLQPFTDQEVAP